MLYAESEGAKALSLFASLTKCPGCKFRAKEPLLIATGDPYPANMKISGEWAFHWQDSHGIPVDIFPMIINEKIGFNAND